MSLARSLSALLPAGISIISMSLDSRAANAEAVAVHGIELDDITMTARLYPAPGDDAGPALVLLHGWGMPGSDPAIYMHSAARHFQHEGYTVLVPTLRGWPPTGGTDDCAGRQVDDVLGAVDWLARRDKVDASSLYLAGFSQGGQIAVLAASRHAPVRATAVFAAVTDPGSWGRETNVEGIREYVMEECGGPRGWRSRSALLAARSMPTPLLLVHGDADLRVPTSQSERLYQRLDGKDAEIEITVLPGLTHDPDEILQPRLAIDFFRRFEHES